MATTKVPIIQYLFCALILHQIVCYHLCAARPSLLTSQSPNLSGNSDVAMPDEQNRPKPNKTGEENRQFLKAFSTILSESQHHKLAQLVAADEADTPAPLVREDKIIEYLTSVLTDDQIKQAPVRFPFFEKMGPNTQSALRTIYYRRDDLTFWQKWKQMCQALTEKQQENEAIAAGDAGFRLLPFVCGLMHVLSADQFFGMINARKGETDDESMTASMAYLHSAMSDDQIDRAPVPVAKFDEMAPEWQHRLRGIFYRDRNLTPGQKISKIMFAVARMEGSRGAGTGRGTKFLDAIAAEQNKTADGLLFPAQLLAVLTEQQFDKFFERCLMKTFSSKEPKGPADETSFMDCFTKFIENELADGQKSRIAVLILLQQFKTLSNTITNRGQF